VWQQHMSKQDINFQQEKGFRHQAQEKKRRATEVCNSPSWP
jgi:hypothetical protein